MPPALRLGTRRSPLALAQAGLVRDALGLAFPELDVELVPMQTRGDVDQRDFREIGQRGIFAAELEQALLEGQIDAAVHSCKDLTLDLPEGLGIAAILERDDPRDVLCGSARSIEELPRGARIATSSMRRQASLRLLREDLQPVAIRGNVQTRLARSRERGDEACMLAAAGLRRLGLDDTPGFALPVDRCVPEAGQGAIAVQVAHREPGAEEGAAAVPLDRPRPDWSLIADVDAQWAVAVERAVARELGGGCDTPLGVHVDCRGGRTHGWVFTADAAGCDGAIAGCALERHSPVAQAASELLDAVAGAGLQLPSGSPG